MNPLLDFSGLPRFDAILPEHIAPAVTELITQAQAALEDVVKPDFPARWDDLAARLAVSTERLARAWGAVSHLHAVADTPQLRSAYTDALPQVTEFFTHLGSDERLYAKYKAMDRAALNPAQSQAHGHTLRNFLLSGVELKDANKLRFAAIQERLAELQQQFSEHVLDSTDRWSLTVSTQGLAGVPADVLAATAQAAQAKGEDGHRLSLKMPCYLPIMQFAHDRALRHEVYRAYATRASDLGRDLTLDNSALITEILALRQEEAHLLGFANAAELSLATKMAADPKRVIDFLLDLARRARPHAEREVADLRTFAREHLHLADPQAWDWTYIGENLKQARYAFSESEVKAYFPAPKVLAGLFKIAETLFEVAIRRDQAPVWHPDVEFYRIERAGQLLGQFYLDPSARTGKRGGAWMDDARARWLRPDTGELQTPVAHMVCNFAQGIDGRPPLLTHDEVITLFHEFGHGLHHMLTQVNELEISGISGVEWDAVELPSQMMENFCWEWAVLRHMTAHVDTAAPMPRELFDKMIVAKNFQTGLHTLRQVELALFDMRLHGEPQQCSRVLELLTEVRRAVAVLAAPEFSRMPHSFSHIFAGGYSAGYYSYQWAEVLSADVYAAFEETASPDGSPSIETGRRYRQAILEVGASRSALESFKAFRGREPSIDALLRHQGMA